MILRKEKIVPGGLLERVLVAYQKQGVSEDMLEKLSQDSPLGQVLASGLRNYRSSRDVMKDAIEEAGSAVAHELERFLTTLGTIATISPLMGLFGTVVGMIEIFGSQTPAGSNPQELAHGISVALYNTGFGLVIAIPAMIFFRHFRGRVEGFVVEMEQQAAKLAGAGMKEAIVVVNADNNANYQSVIRVMDAARQAGFGQVVFAVEQATK